MHHLERVAQAGAVCALLFAGAARVEAQGVASSFEQLGVLVKPGDTITVIDTTGRKTAGRVGLVSRDILMLTTPSGTRQLGERDVAEINQRRGDSLRNGAIVGAVSATTFYIVMAAVLGDLDGGHVLVGPAIAGGVICAGIGAAGGAGIDALITRRMVIYRRGAGNATISLAPILQRGSNGVLVTVRF